MASGGASGLNDEDNGGESDGRGQRRGGAGDRPVTHLNNATIYVDTMNVYSARIPRDRRAQGQRARLDDRALRDFPPPLDLSHHFKEEDLDRKITDSKCFVPVSAAVSADGKWQPLVNILDIKPLTVRQLQNNYRHDTRELTLQLLVRWQRSTAPQATVRQLVKVLCESKNYEAVKALARYFRE